MDLASDYGKSATVKDLSMCPFLEWLFLVIHNLSVIDFNVEYDGDNDNTKNNGNGSEKDDHHWITII